MPTKHGNRHCPQVLLDNDEYQSLGECAKERGARTNALAGNAVCEWTSMNVDQELFKAENLIEDPTWNQSVRDRVRVRKENKTATATSEPHSNPEE